MCWGKKVVWRQLCPCEAVPLAHVPGLDQVPKGHPRLLDTLSDVKRTMLKRLL